jgi:hypothetical protein
MQARTVLATGAIFGVAALAITQMGFNAQDRQYKKTLQYMHDGRDKIAEQMRRGADKVQNGTVGKKD